MIKRNNKSGYKLNMRRKGVGRCGVMDKAVAFHIRVGGGTVTILKLILKTLFQDLCYTGKKRKKGVKKPCSND